MWSSRGPGIRDGSALGPNRQAAGTEPSTVTPKGLSQDRISRRSSASPRRLSLDSLLLGPTELTGASPHRAGPASGSPPDGCAVLRTPSSGRAEDSTSREHGRGPTRPRTAIHGALSDRSRARAECGPRSGEPLPCHRLGQPPEAVLDHPRTVPTDALD